MGSILQKETPLTMEQAIQQRRINRPKAEQDYITYLEKNLNKFSNWKRCRPDNTHGNSECRLKMSMSMWIGNNLTKETKIKFAKKIAEDYGLIYDKNDYNHCFYFPVDISEMKDSVINTAELKLKSIEDKCIKYVEKYLSKPDNWISCNANTKHGDLLCLVYPRDGLWDSEWHQIEKNVPQLFQIIATKHGLVDGGRVGHDNMDYLLYTSLSTEAGTKSSTQAI